MSELAQQSIEQQTFDFMNRMRRAVGGRVLATALSLGIPVGGTLAAEAAYPASVSAEPSVSPETLPQTFVASATNCRDRGVQAPTSYSRFVPYGTIFADGRVKVVASTAAMPASCNKYGTRHEHVFAVLENNSLQKVRNSDIAVFGKGNAAADQTVYLKPYKHYTCLNSPSTSDGIRYAGHKMRVRWDAVNDKYDETRSYLKATGYSDKC